VRILLTGATGFIGSRLLPALSAEHDVVCLTRREPASELAAAAEWIEQDLSRSLDNAGLPGRVDVVVHLAQSPRFRDFPAGARDIFAVNVAATFSLLEYARDAGAELFVLASTGGVYGTSVRARESDPVQPAASDSRLGLYLASKQAAEALLGSYSGLLRAVIVRPFFVYGAGQPPTLMRVLADRVVRDQEVTIQGKPGMRINPIYVGDAVRALAAAIESPGAGVFNVAGYEIVSITDVVELIAELSGAEPRIRWEGEQPGDLVADITRMRVELGVEPETPLRKGLRSLIESLAGRARTSQP
jgi:UDP-glucose 4-epimerase